MEQVSFVPEPEDFRYTFGGSDALLRIRPGTVMRLWTEDAYGGAIHPDGGPFDSAQLGPDLNPQTGPFFVEGAEPGDVLAIHIVDLTPARSYGASALIPFFGGLTATPLDPTLQEPLPDRAYIYEYSPATRTLAFAASDSDFSVALPAAPMLGTVGVAPANREVRTSLVPERFGGNMDTPEMRAGATTFLTVNVDGALFSLGDGHYRQGEGEACGTAVEGAMNVTIIVDLIKAGDAPTILWPRIESDTHLTSIGSARPLENAWKASQVDMIGWLGDIHGLSRIDAYQVLGQIAEAPIANVVDTNYSVATRVDKRMLPAADSVLSDAHTRLRSAAATLGTITY